MTTRLVGLVAVGLVAAVTAAGCGRSGPADSGGADTSGPIAVVASTNVWASVASAVGGADVDVTSIVNDPSGDPHSYEVSAKDAAELRKAALIVFNGGGYDGFVEQAVGKDGPRQVKAADLRPGNAGQPPSTTNRFANPAAHDTDNEHFWYDLPTVAMVAGEIASQLSQIRPSAKAKFIANADAFDGRLDQLEGKVSEIATAHAGTAVAATEPVAHYLLDAAKLTDLTPHDFVDAVEEETDPPAASVAEFQRLVEERRLGALVHNPQTETPAVADLLTKAKAAGIPVVEMTETLPTGQDYLTWMGGQIQALSAALSAAR